MKRDRGDHVGVCYERPPGPRQPGTEGRSPVGAVAVLEVKNQMARHIAITHHRANTVEGGRATDAVAAKRLGSNIIGEGNPAGRAVWRAEKIDLLPAGGAKRAGRGHKGATAKAARRQYGVQPGLAQGAPPTKCRHKAGHALECRSAREPSQPSPRLRSPFWPP